MKNLLKIRPARFNSYLREYGTHDKLIYYITGSPYRDALSETILMLQEKQVLQVLYNTWWKDKGVATPCDSEENKGNANALGVENVGGNFGAFKTKINITG